MSSELYTDVNRKRELVERLNDILIRQLNSAEVLDSKAWELLKVSSATFGLTTAIEVALAGKNITGQFWLVLTIVSLCYVCQAVLVILIVRPRTWRYVPGVPQGEALFDTLLPNYMAEYDETAGQYVFKDESRYLDQLLTDYLGRRSVSNPKNIEIGAISVAQRHNKSKARLVTWVSGLLAVIVIGLIIMAVSIVNVAY